MYRILSASKDAYITNKIINNSFRATDANTGQAGTLDLFKLYNETKINGEEKQIELTRLLIKFDLSKLKYMHNNSQIDISNSSFNATVKLHDVYGGQTCPSNFDIILFPLAKKFDEGRGYDISEFQDIESVNFLTSSITSGVATLWNEKGAMKSGSLGASNIDVIVSGTLSTGLTSLSPIKYFEKGTEDLEIDVTKIISGTVTDQISDHGFLIAYSGSYETNEKSYFVKRFGSRHSYNASVRPKLIIKYDDSIHDNHSDMIFDVTSSLYLNNYHYGSAANILSGTSATELVNANCLVLKIESGSFKKTFNVSQAELGDNRRTGIYSSSFAISSFENLLRDHVVATGSITFNEIWSSSDETVTYLSSSITINANNRYAFQNSHQNLLVNITNLKTRYNETDIVKIRVFAEDKQRPIVFKKLPYERKSQIYHEMYYRVRDFQSGDIIIPFDYDKKSTRLSTDSKGMYFEFYMDSLIKGRSYVFEFLVRKNGFDTVVKDSASKFIIE